jgi:hypothetical protein
MSELLAILGVAVQGSAWLRRWLRFTEPYHRAKLEEAIAEVAADTQRRAVELMPRAGALSQSSQSR